MVWIEFLKAIILGVIQGITEWLPISSTGHMIIVDELIKMNVTEQFMDVFLVVIQLGSIMAVVTLYWKKLNPFVVKNGLKLDKNIMIMWTKIVVSCIPATIVGLLWDEQLNALFYNYVTVSIMLIFVGILFIVIERHKAGKPTRINDIVDITYMMALWIGVFQLVAAVFPGTSRSGATIIGALMLGVSRSTAAEYTFFLAIPVMFGASLLKILKFGLVFSPTEIGLLITGMVVAYFVSVVVIKFLVDYIKKHNFEIFGWYRIVLGMVVLAYFMFV